MPQLDKFTYFTQFFWSCLFLFTTFRLGLIFILYTMFVWWRDVLRESTLEGHHTKVVQLGPRYGSIPFIVSEVMFLFAFFRASSHSSLAPTVEIGGIWLGGRFLSSALRGLGLTGVLAGAVGFLLQVICCPADADGWLSFGSSGITTTGSTHSEGFTYTSDMVEDSVGSRSASNSSVNQPIPREQAAPPALPVMQEDAGNRGEPVPVAPNGFFGGDSVESIQRRLLDGSPFPSAHAIQLARIQAEELFVVKADICEVMEGLHPEGDWRGQGARALDNPRTRTGEDSLENLLRLRERVAGRDATTINALKWRVPWRRPGRD